MLPVSLSEQARAITYTCIRVLEIMKTAKKQPLATYTQNSQETNSSQEETALLNPWSRILDETDQRHEAQLNALINENVERVKAKNVLVPVYRKELRKVLLEYLQWMRAIKEDSNFRKVIETKREFKDTEGFDWLESRKLAIDKRKFLLNRLLVTQSIPNNED